MSTPLSSSVELLLGLVFAYLVVVGLLTYGLPRILMGDLSDHRPPVDGPDDGEQTASGRAR